MLFSAEVSYAWPTNDDWIPLVNSTGNVTDPVDVTSAHLDIVGDDVYPASSVYVDGTYIYYRLRLDGDPRQGSYLTSNGWGILIDTDQNADAYEWMVRIDGRSNSDEIVICQNTKQGTLGDPSDSCDVDVWTQPLNSTAGSENWKLLVADSTFSGTTDYYLEWRYPYSIWKYYMGLSETSIVRYFLGSGPSGATLTNPGDLIGTSLYTSMTIPVLPSGTEPYTGTVKFAQDINGNGDMDEFYPGNYLYISVYDEDVNDQKAYKDTITVIVNSPSGDSVTLTLTETGLDTSLFTAALLTAEAAPNLSDSLLQVDPVESVKVSYTDEIDANFNKNIVKTDTVLALPSADLSVTKTANTYTPNVGDTISFTIKLKNNGNSDASNVKVTDLLNVTALDITQSVNNSAGAYNPSTGIWSVGTILNGQTKALIINVPVKTGTSGNTYQNTAYVSSSAQTDPNTSNDSSTINFTVQGADIEVTKTVSNYTPNTSNTISYYIKAHNNGTNNATNVTIKDQLPTGVSYVSHSITNSGSTGGTYANASPYYWSGINLPVGATEILTIQAQVTAATNETVSNIANRVSADQADPIKSNDSSTATIAVGGLDLELAKKVSNSAPNVGDTIQFTVILKNKGSNSATGVQVYDLLPSDVTYVSHTITNSVGTYSSATGIWGSMGTLLNQAKEALVITATVKSGTAGRTVTNTAIINAVSQTDLVSSNNTASASFTVKSADLKITKTASNTSPSPRQAITYYVKLQNLGPDAATGVKVSDLLPSTVTYMSHSITNSNGTYTPATGLWNSISLANGATDVLSIIVNAPATSGTTATNTATITASAVGDPVTSNNSSSVAITAGGIDLKITKTISNQSPATGGTVVFTVTVQNIGRYPATGIVVRDMLPGTVNYSSYTSSQGTYSSVSGAYGEWKTLSIINGSSATLNITVTVTGTTGQTIENIARITASTQTDIDITNNIATAYAYIGSTDVSITKAVNNHTPTEGDTVQFTVVVKNDGPNPAYNIEVTDLLPTGLTLDSHNGGVNYNIYNGIWNATAVSNPIAVNGTRTLIINATVDSGTGGQTLINYAEITGTGQLDPDTTDNIKSDYVTVQSANLTIDKTGDDATPDAGTSIMYTISVTNDGPHNATNVIVKDQIQSPLIWASDNSSGLYNTTTGIWSVGSLAKSQTKFLIINATIPISAGGTTIPNIANIVSADQKDPDTSDSSNSSAFNITAVAIPMPDIDVAKTVLTFSDPVYDQINPHSLPGAVMIYVINVTNRGDGAAEEVVITDSLSDKTEMFLGDYDGVTTGPVKFSQGSEPSGLTYTYSGITNTSDSLSFSSDGTNFDTYVPSPVDNYDPNIKYFRVSPTGDFSGAAFGNTPSFTIQMKVRIKN